jgi:hypothetical protein
LEHEPVFDGGKQPQKCHLFKLMIGQVEAKTLATDNPEPLDMIEHRFSSSLSNNCQIGQFHLIDPNVEVPVKLHKINPPVDEIRWQ